MASRKHRSLQFQRGWKNPCDNQRRIVDEDAPPGSPPMLPPSPLPFQQEDFEEDSGNEIIETEPRSPEDAAPPPPLPSVATVSSPIEDKFPSPPPLHDDAVPSSSKKTVPPPPPDTVEPRPYDQEIHSQDEKALESEDEEQVSATAESEVQPFLTRGDVEVIDEHTAGRDEEYGYVFVPGQRPIKLYGTRENYFYHTNTDRYSLHPPKLPLNWDKKKTVRMVYHQRTDGGVMTKRTQIEGVPLPRQLETDKAGSSPLRKSGQSEGGTGETTRKKKLLFYN